MSTRRLTDEERQQVVAESNMQVFRQTLVSKLRIEHPLCTALEFETNAFLDLEEQNQLDNIINKFSEHIVNFLTDNDVDTLTD